MLFCLTFKSGATQRFLTNQNHFGLKAQEIKKFSHGLTNDNLKKCTAACVKQESQEKVETNKLNENVIPTIISNFSPAYVHAPIISRVAFSTF